MLPSIKSLLLTVCSISLVHHALAQADTITLQDVKHNISKHSKVVLLAREKVAESDASVQQATMNQLPTLSVFGAIEKATNMPIYENGLNHAPTQHDVIHTLYSSGANFYLNLFNGFKVQQEKALAKIEFEIDKVKLEEQTAMMQLKGIHLYYDIYVQHQWKATMESDIAEKEHELQEIKHLYQAGVILESDVFRAELELSKRRMTLIEIANSIIVNQQQLNVLMGNADDAVLIPKVSMQDFQLAQLDLPEAITKGTKSAYDAHISHEHVLAAERELKITKADYSPKIGLTGSFQFSNPQIFLYPYNASWYTLGIAGVKLSYDINSLYHNKNKVRKATIALQSAALHHELVDEQIRTKIYQAFHNWDEAVKREVVYQKNKQFASENARIIKNAYFSQTTLITDLLDANVLVLKANFELEQAKINILKSYYSLQYEIGQL